MNSFQAVWYEQVKSDHEVVRILLESRTAQCHVLHYLQMVTEKLGKAYYWRDGTPPPKVHRSFVRYLQLLNARSKSDRERIARFFGFPNADSLRAWIAKASQWAYDLERLAPALAGDHGPNTEYPWPTQAPTQAPATYRFALYDQLIRHSYRRQFLTVLKAAVEHFPEYA